jgi:hypothetical protein
MYFGFTKFTILIHWSHGLKEEERSNRKGKERGKILFKGSQEKLWLLWVSDMLFTL